MPREKDFKRLVRNRMKKTGESYTAARAQLLKQKPTATVSPRPSEYAKLAGRSDEIIKAKTGCTWVRWVKALDRAKAHTWPHREIAKDVNEKYKVPGWWAQTVTVGYERIKGLRAVGQRRDGSFEANKSRTFGVPVSRLYDAFHDARAQGPVAPRGGSHGPDRGAGEVDANHLARSHVGRGGIHRGGCREEPDRRPAREADGQGRRASCEGVLGRAVRRIEGGARLISESQYGVLAPGTATPGGPGEPRRLAVFVTHGMGQQVPFATLDAVFERLRRAEPFSAARPEAETVRLGGVQMQRLVLRLPAFGRELHFYEGYWAPLTEGEVTLRDITRFLLRAGFNGIRNSTTSFSRWIFGRWQSYRIPVRTWAFLVVALTTILSLAVMNAVVLVVSAARAPLGQTPPPWLSDALFCDLTITLNLFLVMATVFVATVGLASASRRPRFRWLHRALGPVSALAFALTLLAAILAGIGLPLLILSHLQYGGGWNADVPRWSSVLGERRAAALNTWSSVAFLALPVIAVAYGLATWAWHLISAAGSQMRERGRKEGRLSSFLVVAALGIGVSAAGRGGLVALALGRVRQPLAAAAAGDLGRRAPLELGGARLSRAVSRRCGCVRGVPLARSLRRAAGPDQGQRHRAGACGVRGDWGGGLCRSGGRRDTRWARW